MPSAGASAGATNGSAAHAPANGETHAAEPAPAHLPGAGNGTAAPFGILRVLDDRGNVRPLAELEQETILLAIDHYGGQMSEVARRLGIGRSTLYRKLKEYGIDPEAGRGG